MQDMLETQYPSTATVNAAAVTGVTGNEAEREEWETTVARALTYTSDLNFPSAVGVYGEKVLFHSTISKGVLADFANILKTRPRGCVLPHMMSDLGQCSFAFLLDFGSFRDIQRHRNGVCRMPLLTTEYGFELWYLEQLNEQLQRDAFHLIHTLIPAINDLTDDPVARQYYIPMGFRVPCQVTYALPATLYVLETRSSKTMHPTLRRVIQGAIKAFEERFPDVALHVDRDPDGWTVRRGTQTITAKQ